MSYLVTKDGVRLYYERQGTGPPVVLVHEFADSCRSFDAQVSEWRARIQCIAFNARGYPPSDVPVSHEAYSLQIAAADIAAVLDGLDLAHAHLLGVSMGAAAVLQLAVTQPARVRSMTLVGIGTGSDDPDAFRAGIAATVALIEREGVQGMARHFAASANRRRLKEQDPRAFGEFLAGIERLSAVGLANTMRGVQGRRPPVYAFAGAAAALAVPSLIVVGEDDAPCRQPAQFLARTLPRARLAGVAGVGHAVNVEAPAVFNPLCLGFIEEVEAMRGPATAPSAPSAQR